MSSFQRLLLVCFFLLFFAFYFNGQVNGQTCSPGQVAAGGLCCAQVIAGGACGGVSDCQSPFPYCQPASSSGHYCCQSPPSSGGGSNPPPSGGGSNPVGCQSNADCGACEYCSQQDLGGGVIAGACLSACSSGQSCSNGVCVNPPSGGGGSNPPTPTPTPNACLSACGGASCAGCGGGYCCGGDVCVNNGSGCCPGSAPYFYDGGCHSAPYSPPPPPSGGSCTQPYCSFGNRLTNCDGSYTTCANGCTGSAGSASCASGGSTPPPSGGGSCDGVAYCVGTSQCVKYPTSCTEYCDTNDPDCGGTGGGGTTPPPSSGGGCNQQGQIMCGGQCWSSVCSGTLTCNSSGSPVCTTPPPSCGSGQVACGGSCVGVGGSCPGGWQCVDGSVICPSGWVAPPPTGVFSGVVRIDNGNGVLDSGDTPYSSNWGVQLYDQGTCSGSSAPLTCLPCSPDPAYRNNCADPNSLGAAGFIPIVNGSWSNSTYYDIKTAYFAAPSGYTSVTPNSVVVAVNPVFNHSSTANFLIRQNTFTLTSNVRVVSSTASCTSSSGTGILGANLNLQGGSTNLNRTTNSSGVATFTAPPQAYTLSLQVPSGYSVVGRAYPSGGSASGTNGMSFTLSSNTSATFCIAATNPWFQTDLGDVRFSALNIPVPSGKYASTGNQSAQYPGIYYSSDSNANLGSGAVSSKGWLVNNEYSYNVDTQNRNGTVSYSFYKARAKTEGVTIHSLTPGTLNQNEITESGVYEASGDLVINSYSHVAGRRVVILASGNITINTPITISSGQGVLIVASKQNLTIASSVGQTTLSSSTSSLDGYYSAEGSIILPTGASCPSPDRRLNVGGALIANSLKPFATTGTGTIQNDRTLCDQNLDYPSLYVSSRLDFLTQLTDFYKVPYSKWSEERP